jgi:hypothetical protein
MEEQLVLAYIMFASFLDFIPKEFLFFGANMLVSSAEKHLMPWLPNDAIPYIGTALTTGAFMLAGDDFGTAATKGGATAMFGKLLQTVGKRTIQARKAKKLDMTTKQFIKHERTI